ncbi:MAG: alpha/beta fold hydrolase [Desulfobacterales bacterium]
MDMMPAEITIQAPHTRMAAKVWGQADGVPTLALHGWMDNAGTYDGLAPLLPWLNLVALDLPGHGFSEHRPVGMYYHYTDYVGDVMAAADALNWDRFFLLGHSMGAGIACLAAGAFPERVSRLALIEGIGAVIGDIADASESLRRSVLEMKGAGSRSQARSDFDRMIRARAAAGRIKRSSAEALVRRGTREDGEGLVWRSDPRLKIQTPVCFTEALMQSYLRSIEAPALLITAEDGLLRKRSNYRSRCGAIRNLDVVTLPGGHHLHLDDPGPVAKALAAFTRAASG